MKYSDKLRTIKVTQNIGSFYLTKMTPRLLKTISNKSLSVYEDEINGIQRDPDKRKIDEIKRYLSEDEFASFPNTVILAIRDDLDVENPLFEFDEQDNIKIALEPDIANIVDGQHRLAGFDDDNDTFELAVAIFINLPLGEQAKLFAKINSTQTKVNLDIVYENFFKSNQRSREKTAFFIVKTLNEKAGSPWKDKIKTLSDRGGDLAQGSMAKFIDKRLLDKNKPLAELYDNGRDQLVFDLLFNYFSAIKEVFPKEWNNESDDYILTKTTGFNGFMSFFVDNINLNNGNYEKLTEEYFMEKFKKTASSFKRLDNLNYPSGAVGQTDIRNILRESMSIEEKNFLKIK